MKSSVYKKAETKMQCCREYWKLHNTYKTFHTFFREPSIHCCNKLCTAATMMQQRHFNTPSSYINIINLAMAHFTDIGGNICDS
jgi:hypothetical protein